jgi:hypothetical protein
MAFPSFTKTYRIRPLSTGALSSEPSRVHHMFTGLSELYLGITCDALLKDATSDGTFEISWPESRGTQELSERLFGHGWEIQLQPPPGSAKK